MISDRCVAQFMGDLGQMKGAQVLCYLHLARDTTVVRHGLLLQIGDKVYKTAFITFVSFQ